MVSSLTVALTLAMESPYKYVYEVVLFLYVFGAAHSVIESGKGWVYEFGKGRELLSTYSLRHRERKGMGVRILR